MSSEKAPYSDHLKHDRPHRAEGRNKEDYLFTPDQMTPEEKRVLEECKQERLYYRTLPFAVTLAGAAHIATMKGLLHPHPKYGSLFKVIGAAAFGGLVGEFSYIKKCREKILTQIPNSRLAHIMQRKGPWTPNVTEGKHTPSEQADISTTFKSDYDGTAPVLKGLDDSNRPTMDFEKVDKIDDIGEQSKKPFITYDNLRQRNREEYNKNSRPSLHQFDGRKSEDSPSHNRPPDNDVGESSYSPPKHKIGGTGKKKNEYGDVWDD